MQASKDISQDNPLLMSFLDVSRITQETNPIL